MDARLPGHGGGKYKDIVFADVRHSLLGMIELAEHEGYRLTFDTIVGLIREGLTLQDFLENDEQRIANVREPVKRSIRSLIDMYGASEVGAICSRWTFFHLVFLGMGVTDSLSRLMMVAKIDFKEFENMDYETFKSRTGGRNRLSTYLKLKDAYITFCTEMGEGHRTFESVQQHIFVPSPPTAIRQPSNISKRAYATFERKFLNSCYDTFEETFTINQVSEKLNADERYIRMILKNASEKGLLETDGHDVKKIRRTFEELMRWDCLPEPEIIKMRFSEGLSVGDIADTMGLSRQRVSTRLHSALSLIPLSHVTEAKRYLRRFRRFFMNEDIFVNVFDEHPGIFKLLSAKSRNGKQDTMDMYTRLTEDQKERFERHFSVTFMDGKLVPVNKKSILEKVIFDHAFDQPLRIEEIHSIYRKYIYDRFPEKMAVSLYTDERSLQGIAARSDFTVSSYGNKVRYHQPHLFTQERMERLNGLLDLQPGVYNTRHLFHRDTELMKELDCRDPWELHNIIKNKIEHPHVIMARMPELAINVENKEAWLRHLISEHSPVALEEFLIFLSDNFGLHIPSMRSLIQTNLGEHLTPENTLVARVPSVTTEERDWLSSVLVEDIYTFDQLLDTYSDTSDFYDKFLNKAVLSTVGYVIRGGFIVKEAFGSGEAYFRDLIRSQDLYQIQDIPAARTQTYFKVLKDLETNLEIFRFDEDHYIGLRRLEKTGISKLDIETEIIKLVEHAKSLGGEYFTFSSLQKVCDSRLFDLGMENVFYERLIRLDDRINFIPSGGGDIFYFSKEKRTLGQFYLEHLPKNGGVDVDELMERLEERYLIPFNRSKLIESIKERGGFFSQETGKVYLVKEIFLDSIY